MENVGFVTQFPEKVSLRFRVAGIENLGETCTYAKSSCSSVVGMPSSNGRFRPLYTFTKEI